MDQPNYTYKRGEGWRVCLCDVESRVNAVGIKLTLERRRPRADERYYIMESDETLDDVFKYVLRYSSREDEPGSFGDRYTEKDDTKTDDQFAVIVGLEYVGE